MNLTAEIVIRTDNPADLVAIGNLTQPPKVEGSGKPFEDKRIAEMLYGETAPSMEEQLRLAQEVRDSVIVERDYWKKQAAKMAQRALRAEKKLRELKPGGRSK